VCFSMSPTHTNKLALDSCDTGYYCSGDNAGTTWCCPEGTSTADCAAAFGVAGGLTSVYPTSTTTLTSTSTATHYATATSSVVLNATYSANTTAYATKVVVVVPTSACLNSTTAPVKGTGGYSATYATAKSPTVTSPAAAAATTALQAGGASGVKESMGMVVLLAGAAFAALL
jgi:hypothetical protein